MSKRAGNFFYTSDQVTVHKVTFKNQYQMTVAGNLFVPRTLDRNRKNPAIVVGHPGAVKEGGKSREHTNPPTSAPKTSEDIRGDQQ